MSKVGVAVAFGLATVIIGIVFGTAVELGLVVGVATGVFFLKD